MTDPATWAQAMTLVATVFIADLLIMWAVMIFWTHRDIASRTADRLQQLAAVALVAVFNLPGLLIYLAVRPPDTAADRFIRELEAEALVQERQPGCSGCGRTIGPDFVACPYCRAAVQTACLICSRSLHTAWVLCPYCGAERPKEPVRERARTPASPQTVPMAPQGAFANALSSARELVHR